MIMNINPLVTVVNRPVANPHQPCAPSQNVLTRTWMQFFPWKLKVVSMAECELQPQKKWNSWPLNFKHDSSVSRLLNPKISPISSLCSPGKRCSSKCLTLITDWSHSPPTCLNSSMREASGEKKMEQHREKREGWGVWGRRKLIHYC